MEISSSPTASSPIEAIWEQLVVLCAEKRVPHLLFHGAPGGGKRTLVERLIRHIYQDPQGSVASAVVPRQRDVLWANCAHRKGIRFVREELKFFAQTNLSAGVPFKTVVLYNLDSLTLDAQSALRRCMEKSSHTTRFFGVVVHPRRLLAPILSRFCDIYVPPRPAPSSLPPAASLFSPPSVALDATTPAARLVLLAMDRQSSILDWVDPVAQLYEQAITSRDLLPFFPASVRAEVAMAYNDEHTNVRNEKVMMLRLLFVARAASLRV